MLWVYWFIVWQEVGPLCTSAEYYFPKETPEGKKMNEEIKRKNYCLGFFTKQTYFYFFKMIL